MKTKKILLLVSVIMTALNFRCTNPPPAAEKMSGSKSYDDLVTFFNDWRSFQKPEMKDGVPDYSVDAMKKQHTELKNWQGRLNAFDTTAWPVKHQIDWYLVWAEMNGLDFDHRIVQPWVRDPAFYVWFYSSQPDVPEREGPNIFGAVELPAYKQPFTAADAAEIAARLRKSAAVYEQAKKNLTGNGKDLWNLGARSIREQSVELNAFARSMESRYSDLASAAKEAAIASDQFADWVALQAPSKAAISGIGKADYNWCLKNVHLVPYTWQEEKILLERELARAHQGLRFAEHRNRIIPSLLRAASAAEYAKLQNDATDEYMKFMEQEEMMTVRPYMDPAMRAVLIPFTPAAGMRGFFQEVDYRDPMPMRAHFFHWIDKAREIQDPIESPIRRTPLLYNIFDTRAEGMATAMEELVMNAGMLANRPRAAELVYIMLAQRCARGLGGLYQHGQEMDFDQATKYASKWVPWGLLPADGETIQHEEHFYLQQPAYGESYVTGKIMIDQLIAEYARQREGKFQLKEFMDEYNKVGIIPVSLVYWQMTGDKSMLNQITTPNTKL